MHNYNHTLEKMQVCEAQIAGFGFVISKQAVGMKGMKE